MTKRFCILITTLLLAVPKSWAQDLEPFVFMPQWTAQAQFAAWTKLEELLLVKFIDGNVKAQAEDGSFLHSQYHAGSPDKLEQPGYTEKWKEAAAKDNGRILEVR